MRCSSSPLPRLGVLGDSMLCLFLARFPGARLWCPLLSSRVLWRTLRPLPCSSVCGLYCTGPTKARQSQWETVISCAGSQGLPDPLWLRIVSDASVSLLPHGVTGRSYRRPLSPSSSGCRCHGGADSRPRNGLFRVRWARCFRATAPSLLCEELCCHPGGGARVWLSRSYLRGYLGATAPRLLASLHWFCVVAVQALVCPGPVCLDIHFLRPGVWSLGQPSAFVLLPSFPWDVTVGGSCMSPRFEMLSVLFPGNIGYHFFGISRSFLGNVLIPSLPQLLASSCPGSYGRVGGSAGLCLHPPASMAPGSPSRLKLNLLLIPKVSILSEQMEFCFSQNSFFLILTKE